MLEGGQGDGFPPRLASADVARVAQAFEGDLAAQLAVPRAVYIAETAGSNQLAQLVAACVRGREGGIHKTKLYG